MKVFAIHKDVETQERLNIPPQPKEKVAADNKEVKQPAKKKAKDEEAGEEENKA